MFSTLQQPQSKCDGLFKEDEQTRRDFVEIVEQEPAAHIAREQRQAAAEHRRPLNPYSQVPRTGNSVTLLPGYQLLQNFDSDYTIIGRGEMHDADICPQQSLIKFWDVCRFDDDGSFQHFINADGVVATPADLRKEAAKWELAFAHDTRWLSAHNHDHTCSTTCVKKMKSASLEDKAKAVKANKAPPCRFWFVHVVRLYISGLV